MNVDFETQKQNNFVFLGEAGCGKSEIALNLAFRLSQKSEKTVHFFDMDMTKPLFRSRDLFDKLEKAGVTVHAETQFMDAPTMVGGVSRLLRDPSCYTILDVGGDEIGARAIGAYAALLRGDASCVYYVVNNYRAWSGDLAHIDGVLSQTLGSARVDFDRMHFIGNPNLGPATTPEDVLFGMEQIENTLGQYRSVDFYCAEENLCPRLTNISRLYPLKLYMTYPWESPEG